MGDGMESKGGRRRGVCRNLSIVEGPEPFLLSAHHNFHLSSGGGLDTIPTPSIRPWVRLGGNY